jgi:hypothetical protein
MHTPLIAAGLVSDIGVDTLARFAPAEANAEAERGAHRVRRHVRVALGHADVGVAEVVADLFEAHSPEAE